MKFIKEITPIGPAGLLENNRGFTLVEAVVVLSIVSIVLGLGYSSFRTPEEKLACRHIFSHIQLAKMQAVSNSANQSYDIPGETINGLPAEYVDGTLGVDYEFMAGAPTGGSVTGFAHAGNGITFGADDIIVFTPRGMPILGDSGSVYVRSVDDPERLCAVTVSIAGMVKMYTSGNSGASWN